MRRAEFLARIVLNYATDKDCPFCGSKETRLVGRKNLLLQLRECPSCMLRFRWPKETAGFQAKFYQDQYHEAGFTTDLPHPTLLAHFKATNFAGHFLGFAEFIDILKPLLPGGRVLDYGCSWGYGIWQFRQAGYDAFGFEISQPRAAFGRKEMDVEILDNLGALDAIPDNSLDGIYASHVLEHLLSLKEPFAFFARTLKQNGILMIRVPNSGGKLARELGTKWTPMISEKHTLALTAMFFERNLAPLGFQVLAFSDPYSPDQIKAALTGGASLPRDGEELMVLARRLPKT